MPAMRPLVSVLLPAYNAADTIAGAVQSIRQQSWPDWELVVVDDGSTDATREAAVTAAAGDPRIRVVGTLHGGIVAALTTAIRASAGALIARMDADDWCYPGRLAAQVDAFRHDDRLGLVSSLIEFGGDETRSAGYALHVAWLNSLLTPEAMRLNRFVEAPFAHPSVMFRRECIDRHGGYRSGGFPEDYELWLRWMDAGVPMAKVPEVLLRWNDPPRRLSRVDSRYDPDNFFLAKAPWIAREVQRLGTSSPRPVLVWGAGRPTRKRAAHLAGHGVRIAGYIDIDPKKTGRRVAGVPVLRPEEIPAAHDAFVLGYVTSRGARDLIRHHLQTKGYVEGRDFLMCA